MVPWPIQRDIDEFVEAETLVGIFGNTLHALYGGP